jgi:hypothetical protein
VDVDDRDSPITSGIAGGSVNAQTWFLGERSNLVPLAPECHQEGHTIGWMSWQAKHGIKLQPLADILWEAWQKR